MTDEMISQYGDVCSHAIEIKITGTLGRYFFPDDAILRGKKIIGVFTFGNPSSDRKAPASGNNIITDAALRNSHVSLFDANKQLIADHPLFDLAISQYDRSHRRISIANLTPDKSYIQVADTSLISSGQSFLLHFIYLNN
jgi:hypothetical protein